MEARTDASVRQGWGKGPLGDGRVHMAQVGALVSHGAALEQSRVGGRGSRLASFSTRSAVSVSQRLPDTQSVGSLLRFCQWSSFWVL